MGSRLGDYARSDIEGDDPVDGRWTSCGRAGAAAEIAWEEARDGGATSKGMMWVDGTWTSRGRAAAAEIAWKEARDGGATSKGICG